MPNIYIAINIRAFACAKQTFEWNVYTQTGNTYDNVTPIFSRQFALEACDGRKGKWRKKKKLFRINYARGKRKRASSCLRVCPSSPPLFFRFPGARLGTRGKEVNLLGNRRIDALDTRKKLITRPFAARSMDLWFRLRRD